MIKFWFDFFIIFFVLGCLLNLIVSIIVSIFGFKINLKRFRSLYLYLILIISLSTILTAQTTIETFLSDKQYDIDAILADKHYSTKQITTADSEKSRAVKYYYNTLLNDESYTLIYFNGSNQEYKFKDYEIIKK